MHDMLTLTVNGFIHVGWHKLPLSPRLPLPLFLSPLTGASPPHRAPQYRLSPEAIRAMVGPLARNPGKILAPGTHR